MIEYDTSDEDALWDISERIGRERLEPDTLDPAEIEESARRIAAVLAEYPLRFRTLVQAATESARSVYYIARGIGDPAHRNPDPGHRMSEEKALAAAARFFDAIIRVLEEDALQAIPDDTEFNARYLAKTGSLGHRVLSMLR
jgi:hypothetical protein